ncbi:MAG: hypothetical protein ACREC9_00965 [Methylocella sp.]
MTQSRRLSIIGVSLIALQPGLPAHAQTYPSVVQAEIREATDSCKPEKIELPKDFVTRKDVNADGVPDFIVDWTNVRCKDGTRPSCGSLRCAVTVYASLPNGTYTKALSDTVRGYTSGELMAAQLWCWASPAITLRVTKTLQPCAR